MIQILTTYSRRCFLSSMIGAPASLALGRAVSASNAELAFIFIGASWCPVCHHAAPVLAQIAEHLDMEVLAVSLDAKPISPFLDVIDGATHPLASNGTPIPRTLLWSARETTLIGHVTGFKSRTAYARGVKDLLTIGGF